MTIVMNNNCALSGDSRVLTPDGYQTISHLWTKQGSLELGQEDVLAKTFNICADVRAEFDNAFLPSEPVMRKAFLIARSPKKQALIKIVLCDGTQITVGEGQLIPACNSIILSNTCLYKPHKLSLQNKLLTNNFLHYTSEGITNTHLATLSGIAMACGKHEGNKLLLAPKYNTVGRITTLLDRLNKPYQVKGNTVLTTPTIYSVNSVFLSDIETRWSFIDGLFSEIATIEDAIILNSNNTRFLREIKLLLSTLNVHSVVKDTKLISNSSLLATRVAFTQDISHIERDTDEYDTKYANIVRLEILPQKDYTYTVWSNHAKSVVVSGVVLSLSAEGKIPPECHF